MKISDKERIILSYLMLTLLCFHIYSKAHEDSPDEEIPVGVILDMGSWVGQTVHSCITMALSDFYMANSHYKRRIVVHSRDTHGEPLQAFTAALDLLEKQKVQAIIGSESTTEAKFLAVLGDEVGVPILSLSPARSSHKHPYFLQITEDETTPVKAIAAMAELTRWKDVIIISEDTDNGRDMATFIANAFQEKSISITYNSLISTSASYELVRKELLKLSTMQTKLYILHTSHSLASLVFLNAKYLGMMDEGYKWLITSKTMNFFDFMDGKVIESMQGAVGFKSYTPNSKDLHRFTLKWKKEYQAKNSVVELKGLNTYAIWVYDAISALAMAVERIQALTSRTNKDFQITQRGTSLLNQMETISFHGLGGKFQLMNGRITSEVLEIINVIGEVKRRVGFWTTDAAFTKKIGKMNSFSDYGLESITWPGGVKENAMYSTLRMSSKILKIGVPVQYRSGRVLKVDYDAKTNSTMVSGFCADVFQAAFTILGQDVAYQLIPIIDEHGHVNYNDLIDRVHAGEFDAAIGDITITANRSLYVDFTLPFTDLGLATLTRNADTSLWIFMKPLSSDLWLVSACFCILLGFVIWILEHRMNEEFQGSPAQQIGTTFMFAFSTLVNANRQKLHSNMSRFVVTVWLFVVLVLASSYTATLSSLLTIEQIQRASKSGQIGYHYGSLTQNYVRNLNFKDTRLKPYSSSKEYADALSRGSKNGGVDAIVDEILYIKEFLSEYPSGYSLTVSDATTNGFGFAFPRGSPLAPEISSQIARLREDGTLKALENKWFNQGLDPWSKDSATAPKIVSFKGLRGLFLISGVSMATALFLFMIYCIHEKVHFTYTVLAGGKLAFIMRFLVAKTANLHS